MATLARQRTDDLAKALDAVDVGAVVQLLDSVRPAALREPVLRHRINELPHNRATIHAVALENLFSRNHDFGRSLTLCRLLLDREAPVIVAHNANQVQPSATYAALLFVQQTWPAAQVAELDALFDDYVAAGVITICERFPRNVAAFPLHLPLEAAVEQGNFDAVRSLFRAGCASSGLGTYSYHNKPLEAEPYARMVLDDEARVAQFLSAMMQGRMQATKRSRGLVTSESANGVTSSPRRRMSV